MPKSINDFLPNHKLDAEQVLIQARVDKKLHQAVKKKIHKDKITWKEFIEASCRAYLQEESKDT